MDLVFRDSYFNYMKSCLFSITPGLAKKTEAWSHYLHYELCSLSLVHYPTRDLQRILESQITWNL